MSKNKRLLQTLVKAAALFLFSVCVVTSSNSVAASSSFDTLQSQQKLQISVSVSALEKVIPNQQVALNVDVLSLHPFNADFTLSYVGIDNAVVIQADVKTALSTRQIDGEKWFVQHQKVMFYPLKSGAYIIPSLTATVSVNSEQEGIVSSQLITKPYSFDISEPTALNNVEGYIASPNVSLRVKQKGKAVEEFNIGSAITYEYQLKADKVHALILPKLEVDELNGVQIYRKPVVERDSYDRFEKFNTASSTLEVTFIFQKEGSFNIPEQRILWWDTEHNELKEEVIPAKKIIVGQASLIDSLRHLFSKVIAHLESNETNTLSWLAMVIFCLLLMVFLWKIIAHKGNSTAIERLNKGQKKQLITDYYAYIASKKYQQANRCLYDLLKVTSRSVATLSATMNEQDRSHLGRLQALAYNKESALLESSDFSQQDATLLLMAVVKLSPRWSMHSLSKRKPFKFSIKLNTEQ